MNKVLIAILVVLALGVTGCSVSTGSSDLVDDAVAEMPEVDASNPFAVEPSDEADEDVSDDVVVEESGDDVTLDDDDDAVETETESIFEMQTEADDVLTEAVVGTYYEQVFRMVDKDIDYLWSISGLPAGTGLSLTEEAASWRYKLHGTPTAVDIGTHNVTIEVVDASDISKSTSISFELMVESDIEVVEVDEDETDDPCAKPLRIIVEQFGGNVDSQVLEGGKFRARIGSDANIRLRAVRGVVSKGGSVTAPVGEVKWSFKSRVKNSYHRINKGGGSGTWQMPGVETYCYWDTDAPCTTPEEIQTVMDMANQSFWPDCSDFYHLTYDQKDLCEKIGCSEDDWPIGAYGSPEYEHAQQCINGFECPDDWNSPYLTEGQKEACREYHYWKKDKEQWLENKFSFECKWTKNPTWQGEAVTTNGDVLELNGQMLFDGPLPVKYLPIDQNAVEVLDVSVSDGCYSDKGLKPVVSRTLEIGVQYPVAGWESEGGRLGDVEVDIDFGELRHYFKGHKDWGMDCDVDDDDKDYDGFDEVCQMKSLIVVAFAGEEGLSDNALNKLEDYWDPNKAIKESFGYVAFDFAACDKDKNNCKDKKVTGLDNQSDDLGAVQKIYLLWMSPSYLVGNGGDGDLRQLDFDIRDIDFKTKYWSADYDDEGNIFGYNLIGKNDGVRVDLLTSLEGMSPANSKGGVFRRREMAGYIDIND